MRRQRRSLQRQREPPWPERGRFVLALSGGRTPWIMLRALAAEDVPWHAVNIV
jgi:6-phosphogluconolactonase